MRGLATGGAVLESLGCIYIFFYIFHEVDFLNFYPGNTLGASIKSLIKLKPLVPTVCLFARFVA